MSAALTAAVKRAPVAVSSSSYSSSYCWVMVYGTSDSVSAFSTCIQKLVSPRWLPRKVR